MKRGQLSLSNAPTIVVLLGFTVMLAAAMALSLNGLKSSSDATGTSTRYVTNTFTADNATAVDFATPTYGFNGAGETYLVAASCTGVSVWNNTNAENVTNKYTVSGCSGTLTNNSYDGETHTANYTFTFNTYTDSYNISADGEVSLRNLSDQVPTLGTIIGVALMVVIVVGAFAFLFTRSGGL